MWRGIGVRLAGAARGGHTSSIVAWLPRTLLIMSEENTEPLFDPGSVLDIAFGGHDFLAGFKGLEVEVETTDAAFEDNAAFVEVSVSVNSDGDDDRAARYRYRIEFDGLVDERGPRYSRA